MHLSYYDSHMLAYCILSGSGRTSLNKTHAYSTLYTNLE